MVSFGFLLSDRPSFAVFFGLELSRPQVFLYFRNQIWIPQLMGMVLKPRRNWGFLTVFSNSVLSGFTFFQGTFFDNIDFVTSNIALPVGGLAIVVFAGWFMSSSSTSEELDPDAGLGYQLWRFSARFIAPVAVVCIFLNAIGVF